MQLDLSTDEGKAFLASMVAQALAAAQAAAPPPPPPVVPAAPPARLVSELWEEWARTLKEKHSAFAAHARHFLQLEFTYEGLPTRIGSQPWTALTPRMGLAWWTQLRKQRKQTKAALSPEEKAQAEQIAAQRALRGLPPLEVEEPEGELLSAAYCDRILTTAQGMFTHHVDLAIRAESKVRSVRPLDEVTENPLRRWPRADARELGERHGSFADEEELQDYLECCRPVLADMAWLASHCGGMRRTETRVLEWSWVDLAARNITIPKEVSKTGRSRTFPIEDERSYEILSRRLTRNDKGSKYVFHSTAPNGGDVVCERTVENWIVEAGRKWEERGHTLHGERVTFHHLRHTWAKWSLLRGTPVNLVMEWGGWESIVVFRKYAKATESMREEARKRGGTSIAEILAREPAAPTRAPETRKAPRRALSPRSQPPVTAERNHR